ncbi:membrane integrity-associated transporter subunit PqiC [Methylomicrobium sp. RS1]|nr:membrane integrity-associated transporter subunit PqiC [Methylomicrobium sp. RS1]
MLIMYTYRFIYYSLLSFLLLPLAGCIGGSTPPAQFYLLEPIGQNENPSTELTEKPVVALGPVRVPRYVDRPQIIRASGKNMYQLSELNRWAESLDDNISRVLVQNLSQLASVNTVLANGSSRARQATLRVAVNIREFHVNSEGQAGLNAQWQIIRGDDTLLNRQVSYHSPASTTDYAVMVAALNDCLDRMSRELAGALQQALKERQIP